MPRSKTQQAWVAGYEDGSLMSKLTPAEQKAVRERMKQADRDLRAFEFRARQSGWTVDRAAIKSMSEV